MRRWLKRLYRRFTGPIRHLNVETDAFDHVTRGSVEYTVEVGFVEGATLRDLTSGSLALTTMWAAIHKDTDHTELALVKHGAYTVTATVTFNFEPLYDYDGPRFSGPGLVRELQSRQKSRPKGTIH